MVSENEMRTALDQANADKEEGNRLYQQKEYTRAAKQFHLAMLHIRGITHPGINPVEMAQAFLQAQTSQQEEEKEEEGSEGEGEEKEGTEDQPTSSPAMLIKEEAIGLMSKCYNNLAACILNGKVRNKDDYLRAVTYCDNVLEHDKDNEKALFRKGCAFQKVEKFEKAICEFEKCPKNAQAIACIKECRMKIVEEDKKQEAKIRANFAKGRAAAQLKEANARISSSASTGKESKK